MCSILYFYVFFILVFFVAATARSRHALTCAPVEMRKEPLDGRSLDSRTCRRALVLFRHQKQPYQASQVVCQCLQPGHTRDRIAFSYRCLDGFACAWSLDHCSPQDIESTHHGKANVLKTRDMSLATFFTIFDMMCFSWITGLQGAVLHEAVT